MLTEKNLVFFNIFKIFVKIFSLEYWTRGLTVVFGGLQLSSTGTGSRSTSYVTMVTYCFTQSASSFRSTCGDYINILLSYWAVWFQELIYEQRKQMFFLHFEHKHCKFLHNNEHIISHLLTKYLCLDVTEFFSAVTHLIRQTVVGPISSILGKKMVQW